MPTPENNARFKDTTVTNLVVKDTATINTLKVRQDSNGTTYNKVVLFDPDKDFSDGTANDHYLPTITQVMAYFEAKQKAKIQIYDMTSVTSTWDGVQITSNLTLTDVAPTVGNPGSGIFFRPYLTPNDTNSDSSQAGYYSTDFNKYYNANKLYPDETSTGVSNLKPYYLTSVNVGTGKSLTVYNQGTLSLAHDASSTSWTVSISADGNTITFA